MADLYNATAADVKDFRMGRAAALPYQIKFGRAALPRRPNQTFARCALNCAATVAGADDANPLGLGIIWGTITQGRCSSPVRLGPPTLV